MWDDLFHLLDSALEAGVVYDGRCCADAVQEAASGSVQTARNPFLNATEGEGYRLQTITGDLLVLFDLVGDGERRYHMIAPTANATALLPGSSAALNRPHRHDYLEIVCVLDGELAFTVEGERRRYTAGSCSIINQNVLHAEGASDSYAAAYLSLRPGVQDAPRLARGAEADGPLFRFLARNVHPGGAVDYLDFVPIDTVRAVRSLEAPLTALTRELMEAKAGYLSIAEGLIVRLLDVLQTPSLYACQSTLYYRKRSSDLLERAMGYIQEQRRHVSRDELAEALHYNGNYINDVFVRQTGITLGSYVRRVCMQEAAHLLLNTGLSVGEVARRIGYASRSTFYAQFHATFGMTPAEFRATAAALPGIERGRQ